LSLLSSIWLARNCDKRIIIGDALNIGYYLVVILGKSLNEDIRNTDKVCISHNIDRVVFPAMR